MTADEALTYAQHLDIRLCPIGVLVCRSEAIEPVHFDDGRSLQEGAGDIEAISRTVFPLQFSFDKIKQLRAIVILADERQFRGWQFVYVEPQGFFPMKQIRTADALKQRQTR